MPYVGEVKVFAGNFAPSGWHFCDGSLLQIAENETLFQLIGTTYGGDGEETFALPNLRGRIPIGTGTGPGLRARDLGAAPGLERVTLTGDEMAAHHHRLRAAGSAPAPGSPAWGVPAVGNRYTGTPDASTMMDPDAIGYTGGGRAHPNVQPFLVVNFIISLFGIFASPTEGGYEEPYLGEMRFVAFNYAPKGWATCSGQLLPINQNQPLFALLGTMYGGNGQTTFALPDLRGRVPIGRGKGRRLTERSVGESGGAEAEPLTEASIPPHTHRPRASGGSPSTASPDGAALAADGHYAGSPDSTLMAKSALRFAGQGTPHHNMQPSLALTTIIALQGVFPSPN